ncbi:MAG: hypothetical protein JXJ04_24015, partial [Spirochaetales bacterium]|nr:hypothetical protein [Spirochaetales bacterium]
FDYKGLCNQRTLNINEFMGQPHCTNDFYRNKKNGNVVKQMKRYAEESENGHSCHQDRKGVYF